MDVASGPNLKVIAWNSAVVGPSLFLQLIVAVKASNTIAIGNLNLINYFIWKSPPPKAGEFLLLVYKLHSAAD
ncbi:hypothetical protein, partial [Rhizobium leguminosarum]|uniref:hypothetical protein n=1 Tax=Rhizobium leguminosarum TaxID=384 RepID=UPI003F977713